MKYRTSQLARALALSLFASPTSTPKNHYCSFTGKTILGQCSYHMAKNINDAATGPYFVAHGYMYILCEGVGFKGHVAVHELENNKYVGRIKVVDEFEVSGEQTKTAG